MATNDAATRSEMRRARAELLRRVARAETAAEIFAAASARLRRVVPFDAAAWATNDPVTGLPTAPVRVDDLDGLNREGCSAHWRREFLVPDVNLFRDLARADVPAGGLRASAGDPTRSPRYRTFLQPLHLEDELRAVLRVDSAPWGSIALWRRDRSTPFTRREIRFVAGLSAPMAAALRLHVRNAGPAGTPVGEQQPGVLTFDVDGHAISANEQARAWLDELPAAPTLRSDLGIEVPVWMTITVQRAAAARHGHGDGTARTRVRTRDGRWLACHASCLHRSDGSVGHVVVVMDRATPGEIAPMIIDAYELTSREQRVTQLIARGAGTAEIAAALHLSPHTVRDHVKAIFHKTGVSSRGELVARLYTEFYEPAN